jgi:hypothetical protein
MPTLVPVKPVAAYTVARFYQSKMSRRTRDAVTTLLAFQANPTTDLEPVFKSAEALREFWRAVARPIVLDTLTGEVLDGVSWMDDENNPGRFLSLTVDDQAPAILGHSLAWVLA